VNTLVDERRDPIKASYAAARYLRDLYRIFGDWNLVIAAYNCGPERITRAIHRADGEKDYWKIYPYLPQETRGYVPAFIAANYIMNYYCDHNICPMHTKLPAKSDTVVVNRDVHLKQIAVVCNIPLEELRTLNPQYRHDIVNGNSEPSAIRLPLHVINTFIDNEDSIYVYDAENLLTRRDIADVDDSQPIYKAYKRKGYSRGKASRRGKHVKAGRKGRHKVSGSKKSRKSKGRSKGKRRRR
jgi:membrane-bound lytic murein transglycosylase D